MTPLAAFAVAGCLAVGAGSDRILARDMAFLLPELAAAAPDTPVAFAPAPGVRRVFGIPELRRLALRWHETPAADREICFERPVAPLDPARIRAAMERTLPEAKIEVLDFSRAPAPAGDLEFPLPGLRPGAAGGYWSGFVRYAGTRRFAVWARVNVRVAALRVVAVAPLEPGHPVTGEQLREETRDEFPAGRPFALSIAEVAGKIPLRRIAPGTPIQKTWLAAAKDVVRGDTVRVEARQGAAIVQTEARAEASGSMGQTIPLFNPDSKKRFFGKIEGRDQVSVGKGGE